MTLNFGCPHESHFVFIKMKQQQFPLFSSVILVFQVRIWNCSSCSNSFIFIVWVLCFLAKLGKEPFSLFRVKKSDEFDFLLKIYDLSALKMIQAISQSDELLLLITFGFSFEASFLWNSYFKQESTFVIEENLVELWVWYSLRFLFKNYFASYG